MSQYAEKTTVSSESSRGEIERILQRYGASSFGYGWNADQAVIQFQADGRHIRFVLTMPQRDERRFTHHARGARTAESALKEWEQACRQRWRALALVVKAKLEAVASGITTFETEFLGHIVLPDGQTVGQWMAPQIDEVYQSGSMPSGFLQLGPGS